MKEKTRHSTERMRGMESLPSIYSVGSSSSLVTTEVLLGLLNIRFSHLLPPKGWRQNRSVNHCRDLSSKFPKTDAFGIFEAIKKSPFLNGNFLLSSSSANVSAENGKFKMKDER